MLSFITSQKKKKKEGCDDVCRNLKQQWQTQLASSAGKFMSASSKKRKVLVPTH